MRRLLFLGFAILLLVAGCSTLPNPSTSPSPTPVTFAQDTARAFLQEWNEGDH